MPRRFLSPAVFALALILSLFGGGLVPAAAQDGGEATTAQEDPPPPEEGSEPPFGWLQVSAITCTGGGDPGVVTILLASEYAPPGDCVDGYQALLIDGIDYGPVAPYLELQIEAGYHNLYDPSSGASRDVEIYADAVTSVVIVTFAAPEPTTPPEVVPTDEPVDIAAEPTITGLRIVAHACKSDIQTVDQLYALGGVTDRLNACPAFTLPGYPSPGGTVNGGELYFDFTLAPATGDPQSPTGSGSLAADYFCESSVGPLDNDPTNDRCVSTAGFDFQIAEGPITLTQTAIPDTMRYVAAETGSGADAGVIAASDPWSGYLGLDTSLRGTEHPIVHLYYLNPPRVNVVVHLCGTEIGSSSDLEALGSLAAQLLACPAVARYAEGGSADFGVSVYDGNWGYRSLDAALFDWTTTCESDIGDWNGNGGDNACVDAPTYRFGQAAQGSVSITEDYAPDGSTFGGATAQDVGTIVSVDLTSATVSLDTTYDGDVTIHLFNIVAAPEPSATATATMTPTRTNTPVPPSPTASPTRTATAAPTHTASASPTRTATSPATTATSTATPPAPTQTATSAPPTVTATVESTEGNGTLTVAALYCLTGSGTSVVALAPGASASASDLGGSSCFAGDATIQIGLATGDSIPSLKLGRDGVESIQGVPATGTAGAHTLTEGLTGANTTFQIAPGTVTRVIIRYGAGTAMVSEGVTSSSGGSTDGAGGPGGSATGGLVTDELVGDAGALYTSSGSFSGVSFTSLVAEDVDAEAIASVKDATSLPGVGVSPLAQVPRYWFLALIAGALLGGLAFVTRGAGRRAG